MKIANNRLPGYSRFGVRGLFLDFGHDVVCVTKILRNRASLRKGSHRILRAPGLEN